MARLIDADALIGPLKLQMESYDRIGARERAIAYSECIREIGEAPTVDAAPVRHGRWLTHEGVLGVAYCSVCCYELKTNNTNYCPNCGAKMDGEGEV